MIATLLFSKTDLSMASPPFPLNIAAPPEFAVVTDESLLLVKTDWVIEVRPEPVVMSADPPVVPRLVVP